MESESLFNWFSIRLLKYLLKSKELFNLLTSKDSKLFNDGKVLVKTVTTVKIASVIKF